MSTLLFVFYFLSMSLIIAQPNPCGRARTGEQYPQRRRGLCGANGWPARALRGRLYYILAAFEFPLAVPWETC
jgi:hypothetical protein